MPTYLLRRLLYIVVLLWIISIVSFWLSRQAPGDAVMDYISIDERGYHAGLNPLREREAYARVAVNRKLDLPAFYFSVSPAYMHEAIHGIHFKNDRDNVSQWAHSIHDGDRAYQIYQKLLSGLKTHCDPVEPKTEDRRLCTFYNDALHNPSLASVLNEAQATLDQLGNNALADSEATTALNGIIDELQKVTSNKTKAPLTSWMPVVKWNGIQNQYHQWMAGLVSQKQLVSLVDGRNAWSKIYDALKWTLLLNGISFLIALFLGIFIGIRSGKHDGTSKEKLLNWVLFALFALPSFWLGTLFIYFFASGEWLMLLPAGGLGDYQYANHIMQKTGIIALHLIMPVACLSLGALAYVSRQMKQSVLRETKQSYAAALRLQGVSEKTILNKHVVRNALFPVITIAGGSIPGLLSGSLIIEVIFSIPGMGRLMYTSLLAKDWAVAFPVLMLGAFVTIVSYLLTDIIYKWADPRVKTNSV